MVVGTLEYNLLIDINDLPCAKPGRKGSSLRISDALGEIGISDYRIRRSGWIVTVYSQEDATKMVLFYGAECFIQKHD